MESNKEEGKEYGKHGCCGHNCCCRRMMGLVLVFLIGGIIGFLLGHCSGGRYGKGWCYGPGAMSQNCPMTMASPAPTEEKKK